MDRCARRRARTPLKRGDIYLVNLDPTEGREQRGYRPVVIVSAAAFNDATKLPVVVSITSGGAFARRIGFAVPITGIETTGVVRCDQPKVIDLGARGGRRVGSLPPDILAEVLAKVRPIFE
jgi:mRNA interferase ChpB